MIKKGLSGLIIFFLYLISLLPFWLLFLLSDVIYILLYHVLGYRRKVVSDNMRRSYPQKTEQEIRNLEKKYFRYLADLIVETIKMISISEKEVLKRMYLTNPELIEKYYAEGKSLIAAVGHYCNWELCVLRFSLIPQYKKIMVYKPLSNKDADDHYLKVRGRFGVTLVAMRSTLRKLTELRKTPTFTVLAADQTPVQHETQYFTPFLNQPTSFFLGIEKMAIMFDATVVFGHVKRLRRGYYEYKFVPLAEDARDTKEFEITDRYVKTLEDMINEAPEYWLWSHRRWKFKPEDRGL